MLLCINAILGVGGPVPLSKPVGGWLHAARVKQVFRRPTCPVSRNALDLCKKSSTRMERI